MKKEDRQTSVLLFFVFGLGSSSTIQLRRFTNFDASVTHVFCLLVACMTPNHFQIVLSFPKGMKGLNVQFRYLNRQNLLIQDELKTSVFSQCALKGDGYES